MVADLLSTDAVQIKAGAPVRIDGWGGPPMRGRVTRVDPAGFVKVSALGIEEQRVRTTIDFVDPPEAWSRARARLPGRSCMSTIWSADDALTVPVSALFRKGEDWAVFTVRDGRARTTLVRIGHRNSRLAEVLSGLSEGERWCCIRATGSGTEWPSPNAMPGERVGGEIPFHEYACEPGACAQEWFSPFRRPIANA